jgi:hypothetical protein
MRPQAVLALLPEFQRFQFFSSEIQHKQPWKLGLAGERFSLVDCQSHFMRMPPLQVRIFRPCKELDFRPIIE